MKSMSRLGILIAIAAVMALLLALPGGSARAQDGGGSGKSKVSADDVNRIANKLYCPVCENISLDACGTLACAQWRDEIRIQLESGRTEQQVIDDFVKRFGDRVVGTPQDPTLRALSLVTPWVISLLALLSAAYIFLRWRAELSRSTRVAKAVPVTVPVKTASPAQSLTLTEKQIAEYRARIERDLARRR